MKIEKITSINRNLPENNALVIPFKGASKPNQSQPLRPVRPVIQNEKIGNKLDIMA